MLSQTQIEKTLAKAPLVFIGTITKIGSANLAVIEPDNRTALVKVERVVNAPSAFQGITNTTVTIKLPDGTKNKMGDTKLFYTKKWMYGENLALEVVVAETIDKDYRQIIHEFRNAKSNMERKEKLSRLQGADLVVEGRVIKMEDSELNKQFPISFRSPLWISVSIQITATLKSKYEGKVVIALINKGGETEEATPLEINIGKTGVWLLRKQKVEGFNKKTLREYYIIDEPDDFLDSYEYQIITNPKLS